MGENLTMNKLSHSEQLKILDPELWYKCWRRVAQQFSTQKMGEVEKFMQSQNLMGWFTWADQAEGLDYWVNWYKLLELDASIAGHDGA